MFSKIIYAAFFNFCYADRKVSEYILNYGFGKSFDKISDSDDRNPAVILIDAIFNNKKIAFNLWAFFIINLVCASVRVKTLLRISYIPFYIAATSCLFLSTIFILIGHPILHNHILSLQWMLIAVILVYVVTELCPYTLCFLRHELEFSESQDSNENTENELSVSSRIQSDEDVDSMPSNIEQEDQNVDVVVEVEEQVSAPEQNLQSEEANSAPAERDEQQPERDLETERSLANFSEELNILITSKYPVFIPKIESLTEILKTDRSTSVEPDQVPVQTTYVPSAGTSNLSEPKRKLSPILDVSEAGNETGSEEGHSNGSKAVSRDLVNQDEDSEKAAAAPKSKRTRTFSNSENRKPSPIAARTRRSLSTPRKPLVTDKTVISRHTSGPISTGVRKTKQAVSKKAL